MTSPLEGSLATTICKAMKSLSIDATLLRDGATTATNSPDLAFDPAEPTTSEHSCLAVVETYGAMLRASGVIKSNERKVLILANSLDVTPVPNDRITVRGITFTILEVMTDPALAVWECKGRF